MKTSTFVLNILLLVALVTASPLAEKSKESDAEAKKRAFGQAGQDFLGSYRFKKNFGGSFLNNYHRFRREDGPDEENEVAEKRFMNDWMSSPRFKRSFSQFLDNYHRFRRSFNEFLDNYHRFRRSQQ